MFGTRPFCLRSFSEGRTLSWKWVKWKHILQSLLNSFTSFSPSSVHSSQYMSLHCPFRQLDDLRIYRWNSMQNSHSRQIASAIWHARSFALSPRFTLHQPTCSFHLLNLLRTSTVPNSSFHLQAVITTRSLSTLLQVLCNCSDAYRLLP